MKSVFGVIGTLVSVIYCGGLLYYFLNLSGSVQNAETNGLGPTLLGLAAIGVLFCTIFVIKMVLIIVALRSPRSRGPEAPTDEGGFDADAVIARHLARRSAEAPCPQAPPPSKAGGPARRSSFGRKIS